MWIKLLEPTLQQSQAACPACPHKQPKCSVLSIQKSCPRKCWARIMGQTNMNLEAFGPLRNTLRGPWDTQEHRSPRGYPGRHMEVPRPHTRALRAKNSTWRFLTGTRRHLEATGPHWDAHNNHWATQKRPRRLMGLTKRYLNALGPQKSNTKD